MIETLCLCVKLRDVALLLKKLAAILRGVNCRVKTTTWDTLQLNSSAGGPIFVWRRRRSFACCRFFRLKLLVSVVATTEAAADKQRSSSCIGRSSGGGDGDGGGVGGVIVGEGVGGASRERSGKQQPRASPPNLTS